LLERAEKEIGFSMANGMFKIKMDIDRHGPRRMPDNCKNLDPPYFSFLSSENKGLNTEQDYNGIISLAELDFPILISAFRKKKN
jgi:hypothetical protein